MDEPATGRSTRRWGAAYVVATATALAGAAYLAGLTGLDADALVAHRERLTQLVALHPVPVACGFVAAYAVTMSFALPLGGMLGMLAGLMFGQMTGLALVVAAGTVSAVAVFSLARSTFGTGLVRRAGPLIRQTAATMRANGFACMLFMRIVPVFPFFVVNVVAALAGIGLRTFTLATLLGKVPASFIYTGLGSRMGRVERLSDLVTSESVLGLTCLGLLALGPLAYRLVRRRPVVPVLAAETRGSSSI